MDPIIKLLSNTVEREVTAGNISKVEEKSLDSFFFEVSKGSHFDTGILPLDGTGVLAIRKAFDHTQIVFQHKPDTYLVTWGYGEGDPDAKTYKVAQPYRIVIGDLINGNLLGARHFYSPVPLQTGDQILYHVNLPNLNCQGYNGTSVGWMCLYHHSDWSNDPFDVKVRKLVERASGAEAYNDANMSSTDGPRFYQKMYKASHPTDFNDYAYLWNGTQWQAKTEKDGVDWVLDANLWIPVRVKGIDDQDAHAPNGIPLTLEIAMLGGYKAYYTDPHQPKPVNAYSRGDLKNPASKQIYDFVSKAFVQSKKPTVAATLDIPGLIVKKYMGAEEQATAPIEGQPVYTMSAPVNPLVGSCKHCKKNLHEEDTFATINGYKVCPQCELQNYSKCDTCQKQTITAVLQEFNGTLYCKNCHAVYHCAHCQKAYLDDTSAFIENAFCLACAEHEYCMNCDGMFLKENIHTIIAKIPKVDAEGFEDSEFKLCHNCMASSVICACGLVKNEEDCGLLGSGEYACAPCIEYKQDGVPCYVGAVKTHV